MRECYSFTKSNTFSWLFLSFLNCKNGIKSSKAFHMVNMAKEKKFFRVNLFPTTVLNLYPLETPENQRFSGIFGGEEGIKWETWPEIG